MQRIVEHKIKYKWVLYLPMVFFYFPAFALWIPFLNYAYSIFYLILYGIIGLLFIKNPKSFIKKFIKFYKNTVFKYLVILILLVIINSIILCIIGTANWGITLNAIIMNIFLGIIPIFLYLIYIADKYISVEELYRFFFLLFWINLIVGIIAFIGQLFNITIINNIFDFFANRRSLICSVIDMNRQESSYVTYGLPRLDNLHEEPGSYAQFLYVFLPCIYSISDFKQKIISDSRINKIILRTFIPLTWLNIILTFSPIYLILSIIITCIYYFNIILQFIKSYAALILIFLLFFINYVSNIDLSDFYLYRVILVFQNIKSFEDFIIVEPSLATRICCYINSFCVFLSHPLQGVGFGNLDNNLLEQFYKSPVPLTLENTRNLKYAIANNTKLFYNKGFLYHFIAENGIIIYSFLLITYFKIYSALNNICKISDMRFLKGLKISLIAIFIISFYNLGLFALQMHIVICFAILIIYRSKLWLNLKKESRR